MLDRPVTFACGHHDIADGDVVLEIDEGLRLPGEHAVVAGQAAVSGRPDGGLCLALVGVAPLGPAPLRLELLELELLGPEWVWLEPCAGAGRVAVRDAGAGVEHAAASAGAQVRTVRPLRHETGNLGRVAQRAARLREQVNPRRPAARHREQVAARGGHRPPGGRPAHRIDLATPRRWRRCVRP